MNQAITTIKARSTAYVKSRLFLMDLAKVSIATLCLSLLALAKVPIEPVPITLQTLGVFLIGLTLRPSLAVASVMLYLGGATAGLPILSGMLINPFWIIGPSGGFLLGFIPAAFVISYISGKTKNKSFVKTIFALIAGQAIIYLFGVSWLSTLIGLKKAIAFGIMPFLPGMAYKVLLSASLFKPISYVRKKI
ncbi:biotin transporter BioY [Candidatus Aerophobetes bacterium]|uniref:Biotin transporter n=1 Tax=Aerophobetes bacterium TaxID=2030807 RepID=A0A2A4YAE0_UNCAE|nr:MAG: biotin transporter BioY [Candidatus Aerophobetes bacterium]